MNDKHLRAWFVVFVIAVFMAGAGGGLILDRYLGPPARLSRPPAPGPVVGRGGPGQGPAMVMRRLLNDLGLTPEQKTKVDAILAEGRKRIQQFQGETRARFEAEQREMRGEIEKILTPEQRKRFDEWVPPEGTPGLIWRGPGPGRGPGMGPGRGMGPGPGRGRGTGPGGF